MNARAVKRLAQRCADTGAGLVHLSTNYVFRVTGTRLTPRQTDRAHAASTPSPSWPGEHAALAYCPRALVVRGSGLYGRHGSASKGGNFVQRMIHRAREQGALKIVADQRLTPTYTADLADAIIAAVERDVSGLASRHQLRVMLVARVHPRDHGDGRHRRSSGAGPDGPRTGRRRPAPEWGAVFGASRRGRAFEPAFLERRLSTTTWRALASPLSQRSLARYPTRSYTNGSSAAISLQPGRVGVALGRHRARRRATRSPTSGSSYLMPRSIDSS